ncbi:MAG TPA: DUF2231 domain-containing protein [Acidimicrobiia bacterium]|nr:DUF2231 domain-containing protein [Acidimicrobiia bacterium]
MARSVVHRSEFSTAKRPRSRVAGPYGHPFHPMLVTLPIGAFVSSIVFDLFTLPGGRAYLVDGAYWLLGVGLIGALVAAVFGLLDLLAIPRRTHAFRVGITHLALNVIALAVFAASFAWRSTDHLDIDKTRIGQLVLSAVALAVLGVSGWLGGELAYHYGVRVADEATQQEGFDQEAIHDR